MNKIFRNTLMVMAAGTLAVSCADYNETANFTADPDPAFVEPYKDLAPVKSYINRDKYPNMSLGATLDVKKFNDQALEHAAAITNFNNVAFGKTLMAGTIINEKGTMNFLSMMDLLTHVQEINGEVYGSPLVANANQADKWLELLTSPIEIPVDPIEGESVNFNEWAVGSYPAEKIQKGSASIVNYDNQNVLKIGTSSNVIIVDFTPVDPLAKYTIYVNAKADKDATFTINFSGKDVEGKGTDGKWNLKAGKWQQVKIEDAQSAEGVTDGYLIIQNTRSTPIYIKDVKVMITPDNHRPQTAQEINDTIHYALNAWCDGFMKINEGRIKSFDLVDEPIDSKTVLDNGYYDLKHSTDDKVIYWQDIFGSEEYGSTVSKVASEAFVKYGGNADELKFFIAESGLDDAKKLESLNYWIGVWEGKGAKIDGINAKLNLSYSEDAATQSATETQLETLLQNLAKTQKLIRISNFDIKYYDAEGTTVTADKITTAQRQKLADFYAHAIKKYMELIPNELQAGICKTDMVDSTDPVGLWSKDVKTGDWVRTATYKAFCDALSGK